MARSAPIYANFSKGELSPLLRARYDLPELMTGGAQALTNFIVLPQGPITKRPGTRFVANVFNHSLAHYLIPFTPDAIDPFILDVYNLAYRVISMAGEILNDGPAAAPWTQAILGGTGARARSHNLRSIQAGETRYFAAGGMVPQRLVRTDVQSFQLSPVALDTAPLEDNRDLSWTVYASAATGDVTLTFSRSLNLPAGTVLRLEPGNLAGNKPWSPGKAVVLNDRWRVDRNVYRATEAGTTGTVRMDHTRGVASDGLIDWEYLHSNEGYVRVNSNTSGTVKQGTVISGNLPLNVTGINNSTPYWSSSDWHAFNGDLLTPTSVTLFRERLIYARGLKIWFSETDNYESFRRLTLGEVLPTSSMTLTLAADDASEITFMAPLRNGLLVGTDVAEYLVFAPIGDQPFGPGNVTAVVISRVGSRPQEVIYTDKSVLFTSRTGKRLHEVPYEIGVEASPALDLTSLAEHIPGVGIAGTCYQRDPWSVVWCVLSDGTLGGMTYAPDDRVTAWHRHRIGGRSPQSNAAAAVESICSITAAFGSDVRNDVWMVVRRQVEGLGVRRYIERMTTGFKAGQDQGEAAFLDCAFEYDGRDPDSPSFSQTIKMPAEFGGDTIDILADGGVHRSLSEDVQGNISFDAPFLLARLGYGYTAFYRSMPLNLRGYFATSRTHEMVVIVRDTLGGRVGQADAPPLTDIDDRPVATPMGKPPPLFSGDRIVSLSGGFSNRPELIISHDLPTPCTVLGLVPVSETEGR